MIANIAPKRKWLRALAAYLFRGGRGRIVAGSSSGRTLRAFSAEVRVLRRLNPRLNKVIAHLMLSPAPGDPPLSDGKWQKLAEQYMLGMGFADAPWLAVVHQDTDHEHLHLMACRIRYDGSTVSDANDFRRSEAIVRKLEADLGLIAVASPERFRSRRGKHLRQRSRPKKGPQPQPQPQETTAMDDKPVPPNPFQPGDSQFETWPQPYEPGRDASELAASHSWANAQVPSASQADPLSQKARREMKRSLVEDDYESRMAKVLGDDLTRVHRYPHGATLYFKQQGRISDEGHRLTVFGGMDDWLAAERVVALGQERGWKSISFTGSPSFVEHAMRAALDARLEVIAKGDAQVEILAKVMGERRGGMGAMAGAAPQPIPLGAVPAEDGIDATLAELDVFPVLPRRPGLPTDQEPLKSPTPERAPSMPLASPVPVVAPKQLVVGVLPRFVNLKERLQELRQQTASRTQTPAKPQQARPTPPGV